MPVPHRPIPAAVTASPRESVRPVTHRPGWRRQDAFVGCEHSSNGLLLRVSHTPIRQVPPIRPHVRIRTYVQISGRALLPVQNHRRKGEGVYYRSNLAEGGHGPMVRAAAESLPHRASSHGSPSCDCSTRRVERRTAIRYLIVQRALRLPVDPPSSPPIQKPPAGRVMSMARRPGRVPSWIPRPGYRFFLERTQLSKSLQRKAVSRELSAVARGMVLFFALWHNLRRSVPPVGQHPARSSVVRAGDS